MALIHVLAQVFLDRRIAFWIASISATYLWIKYYEIFTPIKAWLIILGIFSFYLLLKYLFHFNIFLYLKGRKRCPMCYSEVHIKAIVCPYCHNKLKDST
ncbi:hypothetical protein [Hydrogenobacter hydrogenophilus]|nr:hypothetical protein [Hydrogenobacter hydrogenophilus]